MVQLERLEQAAFQAFLEFVVSLEHPDQQVLRDFPAAVESRGLLAPLACQVLPVPSVQLGLRVFRVLVDRLGLKGHWEQRDRPEIRELRGRSDLPDQLDYQARPEQLVRMERPED